MNPTTSNVPLLNRLELARRQFAEDCARALLHYATLGTDMAGKGTAGHWDRDGICWASIANRDGYLYAIGVEVDLDGSILLHCDDCDGERVRLYHETPASLGANHSWRLAFALFPAKRDAWERIARGDR